jgi:hypothetical protein
LSVIAAAFDKASFFMFFGVAVLPTEDGESAEE